MEREEARASERPRGVRSVLTFAEAPVQPGNFGHVALWVWRYYQQRRRGIEHDFAGRWRHADVMLDMGVQAAMQSEYARLRQEMRALSKNHGGVYPVPIYD